MTRNALRMRRYRANNRGRRCARCSAVLVGLDRGTCLPCLAVILEARLPGLAHDPALHAGYLALARLEDTRCAVSGYTLDALRSCLGNPMELQVDRIDPRRGYVAGNMQVMTSYLNRMKGRDPEVPAAALIELRERMAWSDDMQTTTTTQTL